MNWGFEQSHHHSVMHLFESVSRWLSDLPGVRRARAGPRAVVNEQIVMKAHGLDSRAILLRDLAVGGACIRTDCRLSEGDEVLLRIEGSEEKQFEMKARVISVRPHPLGFHTDYGLRLIELRLEDARALRAFVDRRVRGTTT
jgi:hypothetical protein